MNIRRACIWLCSSDRQLTINVLCDLSFEQLFVCKHIVKISKQKIIMLETAYIKFIFQLCYAYYYKWAPDDLIVFISNTFLEGKLSSGFANASISDPKSTYFILWIEKLEDSYLVCSFILMLCTEIYINFFACMVSKANIWVTMSYWSGIILG